MDALKEGDTMQRTRNIYMQLPSSFCGKSTLMEKQTSTDVNGTPLPYEQMGLRDAPSVNRAFPPVGWQSTLAQDPHRTTVCACEKTVVIAKQPAHAIESVHRTLWSHGLFEKRNAHRGT